MFRYTRHDTWLKDDWFSSNECFSFPYFGQTHAGMTTRGFRMEFIL